MRGPARSGRPAGAAWLLPGLLVAVVPRSADGAGPPELGLARERETAPVRSRALGLDGLGGGGAWLLTVDGVQDETDALALRTDGGRGGPLLDAAAGAAIVGLGGLGETLRELTGPERDRALTFLRRAPAAHGLGGEQGVGAALTALRDVLRDPLPTTEIVADAACVVRLERVGRLDGSGFWLSGWIHATDPHRLALTVITPEGERITPEPAQVTLHPREDVAKAFPASSLPSLGFHAYVELEQPSHHPTGWLVEITPPHGVAVQDLARTPVEHDGESLRHRILDPLRVPAPDEQTLARAVMPALERLRGTDSVQAAAVLGFGPVPDRPETTVVIATARADLIVHQLLGFADCERDRLELLFVIPPGIRTAVSRQGPELADLYRVPFRTVLLDRRCGYAAALNVGTGLARGRQVVLLRDDVVAPSSGWLAELERVRDAGPAAAVAPKLLFGDGAVAHVGARYRRASGGEHWDVEYTLRGMASSVPAALATGPVQAVPDGCLMIDADLLRAHGGLCEAYLEGADPIADLCLGLAGDGHEIWCAGDVALTFLDHGGWPDRSSPATRRFNDWLLDRRFGEALAAAADARAGSPWPPAGSAPAEAIGQGPPVVVDRVVVAEQAPAWLVEGMLTHPGSGAGSPVYDATWSLAIEGWAVAAEGAPLRVEVLGAGELIAATNVDIPRGDVAERLGDVPGTQSPGFGIVLGTLGLPSAFELEVEIVAADGQRAPLATIGAHRRTLRPRARTRMAPLLLTTLGRTGSSWLELLMACHPEIVACRPFIHDARLTSYWTQVLRTFSEPASYLQMLRPELYPGLWWTGEHRPGRLPLRMAETHMASWLGKAGIESAAGFCRARIEAFYVELAHVERRPQARYFAEKCWPDTFTPAIVSELFPGAKEILLVRDFRDMVCSILGFNAKRGTDSFGRESADSDEQFIVNLRDSAQQMLAAWRVRRESAHLIRYEDLILEPEATLTRAFAYLDVAEDPATVDNVLIGAQQELPEAQRDHRTSASPTESIGRWREELTAEQRSLCREAFDDSLLAFGYEATPVDGVSEPTGWR